MPTNYNTTPSRGVLSRLEVRSSEACLVARILQCLRGVVLAYTAQVDDAVGREQVLRAAGGVLGCAAGKELGVAGEEVVVDA